MERILGAVLKPHPSLVLEEDGEFDPADLGLAEHELLRRFVGEAVVGEMDAVLAVISAGAGTAVEAEVTGAQAGAGDVAELKGAVLQHRRLVPVPKIGGRFEDVDPIRFPGRLELHPAMRVRSSGLERDWGGPKRGKRG